MTYAVKIQEERDEAKKEGKLEAVQGLMQTTGWAIEKVLESLKIPAREWDWYKSAVHK